MSWFRKKPKPGDDGPAVFNPSLTETHTREDYTASVSNVDGTELWMNDMQLATGALKHVREDQYIPVIYLKMAGQVIDNTSAPHMEDEKITSPEYALAAAAARDLAGRLIAAAETSELDLQHYLSE